MGASQGVLGRQALSDAELATFDFLPDQQLQLTVERGRRIPVESRRGLIDIDRFTDGNLCLPNLSI